VRETAPAAVLGWTKGETRSYNFFGVQVDVQYRGFEDGYTMLANVCGEAFRETVFSDRDVEFFAQELAAAAVLTVIRDGKGALVEVQK